MSNERYIECVYSLRSSAMGHGWYAMRSLVPFRINIHSAVTSDHTLLITCVDCIYFSSLTTT